MLLETLRQFFSRIISACSKEGWSHLPCEANSLDMHVVKVCLWRVDIWESTVELSGMGYKLCYMIYMNKEAAVMSTGSQGRRSNAVL